MQLYGPSRSERALRSGTRVTKLYAERGAERSWEGAQQWVMYNGMVSAVPRNHASQLWSWLPTTGSINDGR